MTSITASASMRSPLEVGMRFRCSGRRASGALAAAAVRIGWKRRRPARSPHITPALKQRVDKDRALFVVVEIVVGELRNALMVLVQIRRVMRWLSWWHFGTLSSPEVYSPCRLACFCPSGVCDGSGRRSESIHVMYASFVNELRSTN